VSVNRSSAAVLGLAALLLAGPAAAQAPAGAVLTLDDAIVQAVQNSRLVKIASLDVQKAESDVRALHTRRLPNFDVKALSGTLVAPLDFTFKTGVFGVFPQIGPVPGQDTSIRTDPRFSTILLGRVAQPLTQLRNIGIGEQALQVGKSLAQEKVRAQQQAVINNVKQLYYGLSQAQTGIKANEEALSLYRELGRVMAEYQERQVVLPGDALTVKTALARQEQVGLVLRNTIATLKEQLNVVLGRDPSLEFQIVPAVPPASVDVDISAAQARAVEQRPEVNEARLKAQQADLDLKLKKAERVPEVSLAFNYLGFYNFEVLPRHGATLGLYASWEPWDWGRRTSEAETKAHTVEQAGLGVREAEALVRVDVSTRARKLQEARAMLGVAELGQQTAREKLRVALELFKQQANLQRQVLEGQAAAAEADQQYQQALAGFWSARAEFDKAVGEK
jgi:outer membrane protein